MLSKEDFAAIKALKKRDVYNRDIAAEIETVIGQLVDRFHAKRAWARDVWHFCPHWLRQVLSHTFAVFLCQQNGYLSLRFANLIVD